jgi:GMP synthase (glutamine-hydrolysing)
MKAKTALVIQHVCFEDLGTLRPMLDESGCSVTSVEAPVASFAAIDAIQPDLLVVMGGPIGAYEDDLYPFLVQELELLRKRLEARRPTLGICLGAQLMARALGSKMYPGPAKEIGWAPLELSAEGRDSCLRHVAPELAQVLHWHGDTFDLPPGAVRLASTPVCRNQAFTWGNCALALQFHPEVDARNLERWLVGHALEIAKTEGVTVEALRQGACRSSQTLARQSRLLFGEWLSAMFPDSE